MAHAIHVIGIPFGSKRHPMRIDESRCERCYRPGWSDFRHPARVGSDENVISPVNRHISAPISGVNIGHGTIRLYFEDRGIVSNVAINPVDSDANGSSDTWNGNRLGGSVESKTRYEVATIFCDKQVRSLNGNANWID